MRHQLFWVAIASLSVYGCGGSNDSADDGRYENVTAEVTIYPARSVVTMDPDRPHAEAVAVAGEKILATGSLQEIVAGLGDRRYTVDTSFEEKVIIPGLIDQHVHPLLAALTMSMEIIAIEDWVLPHGISKKAADRGDYLQRVADAVAGMEGAGEPLFTWGFHHYFHGKLTRQDLDRISDTRPIVVWHRSVHEFILNTAAMEAFEITAEFYATFSESAKAQSNFDEGHFWEQGWYPVLYKLMPALTEPTRLGAGLEFVRDYFHSSGVTLIAEPGGIVSRELQEAQNAVLSDAGMPFRSYFIVDGKTLALNRMSDLIAATQEPLAWGRGKTEFLPRQAKLFADGAIFSQAMQMIDGYTDGHDGEWMMDLDLFKQAFDLYWDAGYQIHIHQNGDAGLEMVLDVLEAALERNPREDHRTTIVHFGFATPGQVERIADLDAIVSANPYYVTALADNYSAYGIGPERAKEMVRLGDVVRMDIPLSFHSDMPMAPGQPMYLIWAAVNRTTVSGRVAGPDQRISVQEALKAVTLDAAYSLRLEEDVGSLQSGKRANLTILEESPYEVDSDSIKDIPIWGTMHEGRIHPISP